MSRKFSREEAPTAAPTFDMERFARESEQRLAQRGPTPVPPESIAVPKAPPTGIDIDPEVLEVEVRPTSVPILVARERVTDLVELPTESFLLAFIDGARDVEAIARASGLPRDLVAVTVADMIRHGVVTLRKVPRFESPSRG